MLVGQAHGAKMGAVAALKLLPPTRTAAFASGATGIGNLPHENRYRPISPPPNHARHRSEPESDSGHSLPYSMPRRCHTVGWIFLLRRNRLVGSYLFFRATNRSYFSAP